MAALAKSGVVSLATLTPAPTNQLTKLAFTDMVAGDMVYLKSDGTFALTDGTAATAPAKWWGMINRSCKAGQPVTAYHGCEFRYGSGLTPGARYFIDEGVTGGLDTAATTGGDVPCAFATSTTNVYVMVPMK